MNGKEQPYSKGISLEMRLFSGTMLKFTHPQTRKDAFREAAEDINSLSPEDKRVFTGNLIKQMGKGIPDSRQRILITLLRSVDLTTIDKPDILLRDYTDAVRRQPEETDPSYLLEAGRIIGKGVPTEMPHRQSVRNAWEFAIRQNSIKSTLWANKAADVEVLIRDLKNIQDTRFPNEKGQPRGSQHIDEQQDRPAEPVSPPAALMQEFLGRKLRNFFDSSIVQSGPEGDKTIRDVVIDEAKDAIGALDHEQTTDLAVRLVQGLGQDDDKIWTATRRAAALDLLRKVDLDKVDIDTIFEKYVDTIDALQPRTDQWGNNNSLLQVSPILSPHISNNAHMRARERSAWTIALRELHSRGELPAVKARIERQIGFITLTPLSDRQIVDHYKNNPSLTIPEIAGLSEKSEKTIYRLLTASEDIPGRKTDQEVITARREEIQAALQLGLTPPEIARLSGYHLRIIYKDIYALEAQGVDLSHRKDARFLPEDPGKDAFEEQVIALWPNHTAKQIGKETGRKYAEVRRVVESLQEKGLLGKKGPGSKARLNESEDKDITDAPPLTELQVQLADLYAKGVPMAILQDAFGSTRNSIKTRIAEIRKVTPVARGKIIDDIPAEIQEQLERVRQAREEAKRRRETLRADILRLRAENPTLTLSEIGERVGIGKEGVFYHLKRHEEKERSAEAQRHEPGTVESTVYESGTSSDIVSNYMGEEPPQSKDQADPPRDIAEMYGIPPDRTAQQKADKPEQKDYKDIPPPEADE